MFLVIYAYALYPLILLMISGINSMDRRPETGDRRPLEPSVTVVVSAYNEEKVIAERIRNVLDSTYPKEKLEILIGSDGSTDDTNKIIDEYASKGVRYLKWSERRGKISVINDLVEAATGEIVILTDSNTAYEKDAIEKLVRGFADERVGCVSGELIFRNTKENEVVNLEGVYWRYEQFMKRIEGVNGSLLGANGGIYAIRRNLFDPMERDTIVDDFLIPMKILEKGYRVIYEPQAIAYEETSKNIVQEMERRIRIGAGDFQALTRTWHLLNPARGFPAFAYFSHKVLRWLAPFFLICAFMSNMALLNHGLYRIMFIIQCIFYGAAIAGRMLAKAGVKAKLLGLPHYFVSMNIALFLGFIRFCTNSQSVMWKRTER